MEVVIIQAQFTTTSIHEGRAPELPLDEWCRQLDHQGASTVTEVARAGGP
jgi:hypothetical protein